VLPLPLFLSLVPQHSFLNVQFFPFLLGTAFHGGDPRVPRKTRSNNRHTLSNHHLSNSLMKLLKVKYLNYQVYSNIATMHMESEGMPDKCNQVCLCPIKGVIDVISKKWALLVVNTLGNREKVRFNDLMKELNGISPKTLSDTLKDLQNEKLIRRESFAEIPPRVEYSLTENGTELRKAIIPLIKWAATREHTNSKRCVSAYRHTSAHCVTNQQDK